MSQTLQASGVTLRDPSRTEYIDGSAKIRPLRDRIVVEPTKEQLSSVLQVVHSGNTVQGIVRAVGPGYRVKKIYRNSRGEPVKSGETGAVRRMDLRVGDTVRLEGFRYPEFVHDGKTMILCQENDVVGVI